MKIGWHFIWHLSDSRDVLETSKPSLEEGGVLNECVWPLFHFPRFLSFYYYLLIYDLDFSTVLLDREFALVSLKLFREKDH